MIKKNLITKTISFPKLNSSITRFESFCNDKADKYFAQLLDQQEKVISSYILDFEKETSKLLENFPTQYCIKTWFKDFLWAFDFNSNEAFKLNCSTFNIDVYPWKLTEYIMYPPISWTETTDNSFLVTDNVLAFTTQHQFHWFNSKTKEIKKMPFVFSSNLYSNKKPRNIICDFIKPNLKPLTPSFFEPNKFSGQFEPNPKQGIVGKINVETGIASILKIPSLENTELKELRFGRSFTNKKGFQFLQFDESTDLVLSYLIPHQNPEFLVQREKQLIFSKKDKDFLWTWIIDTDKKVLITLKFPQKMPVGYFNLKKYVVNTTYASLLPNQRWEQVLLEKID